MEQLSFPGASPKEAPEFFKSLKGSVGRKTVRLLKKHFAEDILTVLEYRPEKLRDVKGIGPKRQAEILESWNAFRARGEMESFFLSEGLPTDWIEMLWTSHGSDSLNFLKSRPYQLVFENRIPFEQIDPFALRWGFELSSPARLKAGFLDLIESQTRSGHCAYPEDQLLARAEERLKVSREKIEEILEVELVLENLVLDTINGVTCVFPAELHALERQVARRLLAFRERSTRVHWLNFNKVLNWAQSLLDIRLAPLQKEAVETVLSSPLTVITGGPGTGKTTLTRSLITILQAQFARVALCSPTGRAAQRLSESTGVLAQTVHRLLLYDTTSGHFRRNRQNPLDYDMVLVDEASMLDLRLMAALLDALPDTCSLVLIGDADQLPSVGAGAVLQSILACGRFPVVTLKDTFRQSEDSLIRKNAGRVNEGLMPMEFGARKQDFHYFPVSSAEEAKRVMKDLVARVALGEYSGVRNLRELQILTPMNQGDLGSSRLNEELRLPADYGQSFKEGDKVMVIKNDYRKSVFNGDIGFVSRIDRHFTVVDFGERRIHFTSDELDKLTFAYAISIHKSQGSEYHAVIVLLGAEHMPVIQRHLVYTAITRGKEHVFLIADPHALKVAIQSDDRRWEKLTERLTLN